MCKTLATLPSGITRQKISFFSTDGVSATGFTNNCVTFKLPKPMSQVIGVAWKNNNVFYQIAAQPAFLTVDKFDNSSYFSSGGAYWACLIQSTNFESEKFPATTQNARSYQTLQFTLSGANGQPFASLAPWFIEIEFLVQITTDKAEEGSCETCKTSTCGSAVKKGTCPYAR
jgi:hypothetical protein